MAVDFSFLDNLFTDEDTTDYTDVGLFDEAGNYNPASADFLDDLSTSYDLDYSYDPSNYGITSLNFDIGDFLDIDSYIDDNPVFDDAGNYTGLFQEYTGPGTVEEQVANFTDNFINNMDPSAYDETLQDLYPGLFPTVDLTPTAQKPCWLDTILGFLGVDRNGGKSRAQGIMQGVTGGITDFANSPIGQLLLLNYLNEQRKDDIKVPIGAEAYGDQGLGSMPDYRVFNIQPALMPGVAYANAPPPEMKHGGVHGAGKDEGPGDITLARLEPGEFVMTRKATENLGARNLYNLMKQAERMG